MRARLPPVLLIALVTLALWAFFNRPVGEPLWPDTVRGYAFSPMRAGQSPAPGHYPSMAQIDADLALLAPGTAALRTYTVTGPMRDVPALAARHGLRVTLGAWLGGEAGADITELDAALALAEGNGNVDRLLVGNETLLRGDLTGTELIAYLDYARSRSRLPVATAEPWHVWLAHPELARHVDFIAVHVLPYWEGVALESALDHLGTRMAELERRFPGKPIVLAEVGWPSAGRPRGEARPGVAYQAVFLRRFLAQAERMGWDYFLMEAFDQPWKRATEGAVGAYWGVYDVEREPKFAFSGPVVRIAGWPSLALVSVLLATLAFGLLTVDGHALGRRGRLFLALVALVVTTPLVYVAHDFATRYLNITDVLVGMVLALGGMAVLLVLFTEAHEWAEAHWSVGRRRAPARDSSVVGCTPSVCIHVPVHDESPELVSETLRALAALDYERFEVLVVDNNTASATRWRPIQRLCAELGPRFGFIHVDGLAGYKAGALNLALRHTAPDAEIIAVVDSDYRVEPGWLRELVPQFADPDIVVVQAPQDYHDGARSLFKSMCEAEYRGFFHIGMVTRNDRNAIIQHGTMTLVRREALAKAGGWAEWTVTEDAELGLRLMEHGGKTLYVARSYGRGLVPDNFLDYKRQRDRWAFGAMQILRGHRSALFGWRDRRLSAGQRYHFVAGWLPWLSDGLNLLFSVAAILWCVLMVAWPQRFDPPLLAFSALPLSLFAFRISKLGFLYRARVRATVGQTFGAAIAGLALTHAVGRAVLAGLLGRQRPFVRTPKLGVSRGLCESLLAAREETALALALIGAAIAVDLTQPLAGVDVHLWQAVLLTQAVPYLAAIVLSLVSVLPPRRPLAAAEAANA